MLKPVSLILPELNVFYTLYKTKDFFLKLTDTALCDIQVLSRRVGLGLALPSHEGEGVVFMVNKATIFFLISSFCFPFVSSAYETIEVRNGGSIQGIVEYSGTTIPQDKTYTLSSEVLRKQNPFRKISDK
jgi:hypothetical protein